MSDWNPKSLWDELVQTFKGWTDDDEDDEQARDPGVMYHLMYTAPLLLAVFAMMTLKR